MYKENKMYATGIPKISESILSKNPPCPGRRFPLSLKPPARLNALSIKSPIWPAIAVHTPAIKQNHQGKGRWNKLAVIIAVIPLVASPPSAPSTLFFRGNFWN